MFGRAYEALLKVIAAIEEAKKAQALLIDVRLHTLLRARLVERVSVL